MGIVCKIWNVGSGGRDSAKQISDSVAYITNEEKTSPRFDRLDEKIARKNTGALISYAARDVKTLDGLLTVGINVSSVEKACEEMIRIKKHYGKLTGRLALHGTISLPEEESDHANAGNLLLLAKEAIKELFPGHQAVVAVHLDTDDLHAHFVVNSVGLDGRKIHQPRGFVKNRLQPCVNRLAEKYGFKRQEKWDKHHGSIKDEFSFGERKAKLREDIDLAIERCSDFSSFITGLEKMGYRCRLGEVLSLFCEGMAYPMRTTRLGKAYSVEGIARMIEAKYESLQVHEVSDLATRHEGMQVIPYVIRPMKKYKEMDKEEKARAISLLKRGKNPWRDYYEGSWAVKRVQDKLARDKYAADIMGLYGIAPEAAMEEIYKRRDLLRAEKKQIREDMTARLPMSDLYLKAKKLEKQAWLYEETKKKEYEEAYSAYKSYCLRMEEGFGKTMAEVADHYEDQKMQLLYADAQIEVLDADYKAIKKYCDRLKGRKPQTLYDMLGIREAREYAAMGYFVSDSRIIYSKDSDISVLVSTGMANVDDKAVSETKVSFVDANGEVLDEIKSTESDFAKKLFELQNKHEFKRPTIEKPQPRAAAR